MLTLIKKSRGLLGMNSRNLEYIRPKNSRSAVKLANNKLASKKILAKNGIPVPEIYGVLKNRKDLEQFDWSKLPKSFVLKPNRGMGGDGIVIVYGKKGENCWVSAAGRILTLEDIKGHILNIFDGSYSMYGGEDIAFLEERIKISKTLKPYSYRGIPDVRVIVYNNVPVMAMLRLSTKDSDGKANLHMGGIGVGIDIATGITTHAVMRDRVIEKSPDTKLKLSGVRVPYWKDILAIAIRSQKSSGLGYIGVDIAIDKEKGPVVLEINAHAGLSIQIANMAPLKYRLQKVRGLKIKNENHAIRVAQDLFGGEIEQEIAEISGKQILGIVENVKVGYRGEETRFMDLRAKVDTGANSSSIDKNLAKRLGYAEIIDEFDDILQKIDPQKNMPEQKLNEIMQEYFDRIGGDFSGMLIKSSHGSSYRLMIKMDIVLAGVKIRTSMSIIDRSNLQFPVIVGRKSLRNFLVDPSKSSGGIL